MKNSIKMILAFFMFFILLSPYVNGYTVKNNPIKSISTTHNPILFIHGWARSSSDFTTFMQWFEDDGWTNTELFAYNFDDTNNCSIQANINNAIRISQWVDAILNETGEEKIDLVGHSMGGLNSRYYIKFLDGLDKVDDHVSLGSPHHGENVAPCGAQGLNALATLLNEGDETPGGILNDIIGNRTDPMTDDVYNSTHIPGNISYVSIYSLDDVIPYISSPLDGAENIEVDGLDHFELLSNKTVYELIREAIYEDLTTTQTTTQTSTSIQTTTSIETTDWQFFPILVLLIPLKMYGRKKMN